jgi:hypothetical protein
LNGFASKVVSFTPGLQPGAEHETFGRNRFNGFPGFAMKTVKTVSQQCECLSTGLKPGVNEKDF